LWPTYGTKKEIREQTDAPEQGECYKGAEHPDSDRDDRQEDDSAVGGEVAQFDWALNVDWGAVGSSPIAEWPLQVSSYARRSHVHSVRTILSRNVSAMREFGEQLVHTPILALRRATENIVQSSEGSSNSEYTH